MRSNYQSRVTAQFSLLSNSQKQDIHHAALEVLRRTGVRIHCQEAVDLMAGAGCKVDDANLVRIPAHLVEEAIRTAPPSITMHNRNGEPALYLEGTNVYNGTGSDLPNIIDPYTGERRTSLKNDIAGIARLCDALPNIDAIMSMALPSDVNVATSDVHSFEAMVANSVKPIVYTAHGRQGLADIIDMAATISGGMEELRLKPFLILYAEPTTPLQHSKDSMEKLLLVAEKGLPVTYISGIVVGAASPMTMAGTMVLGNAELLSALVIAQLKRPGTPVLFGCGASPLDMRTTVAIYASPEFMLMTAGMVEMGRYYNMPTWGYAGCSDSKVFDAQATLEGGIWSTMAALSGANLTHDVGYLESGLTCSMEMIVAMDEVHGLIKRLMGGIEVSEETMAVDLIDRVGPGGDFLSTEHTLKHYKENWYPAILDRHNYQEWEQLGKKNLEQRANEKVRNILENHQPEPLPPSIQQKLSDIVRRADERAAE